MKTHAAGTRPGRFPSRLRRRFISNDDGLRRYPLGAGWQTPGRACVLRWHGFAELACSWRQPMTSLTEAGVHVPAPEPRRRGRTTGRDMAC